MLGSSGGRCPCALVGRIGINAVEEQSGVGAAGAGAATRQQQRNERERNQRARKAIAAGRQPGVAGRPRAALPSAVMAAVAEELEADIFFQNL